MYTLREPCTASNKNQYPTTKDRQEPLQQNNQHLRRMHIEREKLMYVRWHQGISKHLVSPWCWKSPVWRDPMMGLGISQEFEYFPCGLGCITRVCRDHA